MSDRLKLDFDIFYKELQNFTEGYKSESQAVQVDKSLSRIGKSEKSDQLKASHLENVDGLAERFSAEFQTRVERISDAVNGAKSDLELNAIQKKFSRGERIPSDETSRLLLHEMMENKTVMRKSNFQQMLSGADIEQVRKTAQTLRDSQDVEKLNWLQEMVSLRGDTALANTIAAQIDSVRTANLNDEQRNLQNVSERIKKGMKLFEYSLERSKTGSFVDARGEEI